jgi:hypothetical protein
MLCDNWCQNWIGLETALDRYTAIIKMTKKQIMDNLVAATGGHEAIIRNNQAKIWAENH